MIRLLAEEKSPPVTEKDLAIAKFVTNEIEDGDTLQVGIGSVPNAVMAMLERPSTPWYPY